MPGKQTEVPRRGTPHEQKKPDTSEWAPRAKKCIFGPGIIDVREKVV